MSGLSVLTPTGGRPFAFSLAERWMARQTFGGEVQWLVADDGQEPTKATFGQEVVRVEPHWKPGQNTQCRNLLELVPLIRHERIVVVEDDDWYGTTYLETMDRLLGKSDLAGTTEAHYYNVRERMYRRHMNTRHASLCETAFTRNVLPLFEQLLRENQKWIDIALWEHWKGSRLFRSPEPRLCVGIKGLPGRPGIGMGHRAAPELNFERDVTGNVLRSWIGEEDAAVYDARKKN